jgi:hypothetical protein
VRNGVPFHIAFGMTREQADQVQLNSMERAAMSIIFSECEGATFDWARMEFKERK